MKLNVKFLDGTSRDVTAGAAAKTALERKTGMIWFDVFNDKTVRREEHLYFLAWRSLPRDERPDDFDEWLEDVEDVELIEQGGEPDPTETDPGAEA